MQGTPYRSTTGTGPWLRTTREPGRGRTLGAAYGTTSGTATSSCLQTPSKYAAPWSLRLTQPPTAPPSGSRRDCSRIRCSTEGATWDGT